MGYHMADKPTKPSEQSIDRRRVLQTLGAGVTTSLLAGCQSNPSDGGTNTSGGGGADLGERVPTLNFEYWANAGNPEAIEQFVPVIRDNLENRIGVDINLKVVEWATNIGNVLNDKRTAAFSLWGHTNNLARLDPHEMIRRYAADWAGADGKPNAAQYANCEYTSYAIDQQTATPESKRRELVNNAQELFSKDMAALPLYNYPTLGAYRTDLLNAAGIGKAGILSTNPLPLIKSEPKGDLDHIAMNIENATAQTSNFPTIDYLPGYWTRLVHSPLVAWDENYKLTNVLADSIDVSDDGLTITVKLRNGTFHNGDKITADDVRFTFNHLSTHSGSYPYATDQNYESIEAIDDSTVKFTLAAPNPSLINQTFTRWGILHADTWQAAAEDPEGFTFDPMIGSGPFSVTDFQTGSQIQMTPHDGHPIYSPNHDVLLKVFRDQQTVTQATLAGELQMSTTHSNGTIQTLQSEMGDKIKTVTAQGMFSYTIYPQFSFAPSKFQPFRAAVGAAVDRQKVNEFGSHGKAPIELYSCLFSEVHPWRAPEDRLTKMAPPTGDEEKARKLLSDAGWGWDDQGRLHYPPDADLAPSWPKGEQPTSEEYPCLTSEGEYKPE